MKEILERNSEAVREAGRKLVEIGAELAAGKIDDALARVEAVRQTYHEWEELDQAAADIEGVIRDRDLTKVEDFDPAKVTEFVTHSWYGYEGGDEHWIPANMQSVDRALAAGPAASASPWSRAISRCICSSVGRSTTRIRSTMRC